MTNSQSCYTEVFLPLHGALHSMSDDHVDPSILEDAEILMHL